MALAMLCVACFAHAGVSEGFAAKTNIVTAAVTRSGGEEITEDPEASLFLMGMIGRRVEELVEEYQPK